MLKLLVIGGPQGVAHAELGVDHIDCDFASILNGATSQYYDYDLVIYWPNESSFSLPDSPDKWVELRDKHDDLPVIPAGYWTMKSKAADVFPARGEIADTSANEYFSPNLPLAGRNLEILEEDIAACATRRLRVIIEGTKHGLICFVVHSQMRPTRWTRFAFDWLSPHLVFPDAPEETPFYVPTPASDHEVVGRVGALLNILPGLGSFQVSHERNASQGGFPDPFYGETTWEQIFAGTRSYSRKMEPETWPPALETVHIVKVHVSRTGNPKTLAFLSQEGGIAVIPAPASLQDLVAALAPQGPGVKKQGVDPAKEENMPRKKLSDQVPTDVRVFFHKDSKIKSLKHLAQVIDESSSQEDAATRLGLGVENLLRTVRQLKQRQRVHGPRDALARFADEALTALKFLPLKS